MTRQRLPFVLSTGAVLWSLALVGVAYWLPAYSGNDVETSCSQAGTRCSTTSSSTSATLVEMNGDRVVAIIGILIALTVICWLGLHVRCATGSRVGLASGWITALAMLAFALISFGLGLFVAPMAIMMIVAAATVSGPPAGPAGGGRAGPDRARRWPRR